MEAQMGNQSTSTNSLPQSAQVNSEQVREMFAEMRRKEGERQAALPRIRTEGAEALQRLLKVALAHSGQCKIVANFLLSCYNGNRFKFDLTDFRCLDHELFQDCLTVLRMDYQPQQEVHCYFKDGSRIWEQLAKDWGIRDYTKAER
jgi:DNA-binding TFAR19-related protein (PDSD5 family)